MLLAGQPGRRTSVVAPPPVTTLASCARAADRFYGSVVLGVALCRRSFSTVSSPTVSRAILRSPTSSDRIAPRRMASLPIANAPIAPAPAATAPAASAPAEAAPNVDAGSALGDLRVRRVIVVHLQSTKGVLAVEFLAANVGSEHSTINIR